MEKKSFNFLLTVVVLSMVALGTFKITKKINQSETPVHNAVNKTHK